MITLETLDNTLLEYIRRKAVSSGLYPDWRALSHITDDRLKQQAFEDAKKAITNSGKDLIEVYNVGSSRSRHVKGFNKIILNRTNISLGSVGATHRSYYVPQGSHFIKKNYPNSTHNIEYDIRLVCNNSKYERIMHDIILGALGTRKSLPTLLADNTFKGSYVNIENTGNVNLSSDEFIEYVYKFSILDVWLDNSTLMDTITIAPITQLRVATNINTGTSSSTINVTID